MSICISLVVRLGGLEPPRPKLPPPQECLPKRHKQKTYNNLQVKTCSLGLKSLAVPVI
jgi:hypothetical protein